MGITGAAEGALQVQDIMKKVILGLQKEWIAIVIGIMGVLILIFPVIFANAVPYILGLALIAQGIVSLIALYKYKKETKARIGGIVIFLVLGIAILFHTSKAIGPIGCMWAMISLYEVAEELTESIENKCFTLKTFIVSAVSITLAIMLLFDPFEHFAVHLRILGLEMVTYVFIRRRNLLNDGQGS